MNRIYSNRPKSGTARYVWDEFVTALGQSPTDISFGYAEHYGQIWTANVLSNGRDEIWAYSKLWPVPKQMYSGRLNNF